MSNVGINIGALTVKVVAVQSDVEIARVMAHRGRPLEVLDQLLALPEFAGAESFGVSGHLGHISSGLPEASSNFSASGINSGSGLTPSMSFLPHCPHS